jgi:uncharacterized protein (TIGR03000 family)
MPSAEGTVPVPSSVVPASSETEVRVLLPDAGAQVWIDGLKSSGTDATRFFGFPDETPGKHYLHKITVTLPRDGKMVTEEREVRVGGGGRVMVDFRKAPPKP